MLYLSSKKCRTVENFDKNAIESAYCIFHQKLRVYIYSVNPVQKDEIETAVASYAMDMNRALYEYLAAGKADYLMDHLSFRADLEDAVDKLEKIL